MRLVADCHNDRGRLLQNVGRLKDAEKEYGEALRIYKAVAAMDTNDTDTELALGRTCTNIGELLQMRADTCLREPLKARRLTEEAGAEYYRALELLAPLVKKRPDNRVYRLNLATCYSDLGDVERVVGRSARAEEYYRLAREDVEKLMQEDVDAPEFRHELAAILSRFGLLLVETNRPDEAESRLKQAHEISKQLANNFPNLPEYQHTLGDVLARLGRVLRTRGKMVEACQFIEMAICSHRAAVELNPQRLSYRGSLRDCYLGLVATLLRDGNHVEAARRAAELTQLDPDRWEEHFSAAVFLSRCVLAAQNDAQLASGDRMRAINEYVRHGRQYVQEVARRCEGDAEVLNQLSWFLCSCPAEQCRDAHLGVMLAQKAVARKPEAGAFWNTLGLAEYRAGNWDAAVGALEKSIELKGEGDCVDRLFMAMASWQLGDKRKAQESYREALRWMKKFGPATLELRSFQEEASGLLGPLPAAGAMDNG
jgi:tetratricopeptide (TPR) repeat protein